MTDLERYLLLTLASQLYINECDNDVADYTVHDALYNASCQLDCQLPDDKDYDGLSDDLRWELGIYY
jgi:hypothetical protein